MRSAVTQVSSKIEITDVRDVQVSDAVDDGAGGFVRSVKFFGEPSASAGPALIFEVLIQSSGKADLNFTTPTLSF